MSNLDTKKGREQVKKQTERPGSKVIPFPDKGQMDLEKLEEAKRDRVRAFEKSRMGLEEVMAELVEVERLTGRDAFSTRVCLAFSDIILDALRLAKAEAEVKRQRSQKCVQAGHRGRRE